MRSTLRTTAVAGVLAVGGLLAATSPAHAGGCCGGGGGGYRGGATYGRGFSTYAPAYTGGSCCNMNMAGMSTGGMPMPVSSMQGMGGMPMPAAAMQGMNMGGYAAPAPAPAPAAGATYYCPMHPNVVSATPAACPLCRMALQRR